MSKSKRDDVSVKIDATVYREAKMVATYRGITLAEYLSEMLAKPVHRDHLKMKQEFAGADNEEVE